MWRERARMCLPGKAYAAGILLELWIIEPLLGRDGPREGGVFNLHSSLGVGRNILISLLDHSMATDGRRGGGDRGYRIRARRLGGVLFLPDLA